MTPELFAFVAGLALVAYAVSAGADYGGGVWDLMARRPSRPKVRATIEHSIAPIWEANHVWLIFLVVLLFTVFPKAFAAAATALHIPLTVALLGMVVRGSAFVFRAYGLDTQPHRRGWGIAFGVASIVTPIFLGMSLAALASGEVRVEEGAVVSGFFAGWCSFFAVSVGVFSLCLFLLLSAVYLAYDADGEERAWFKKRALIMEGVCFVAAGLVSLTASQQAPQLFAQLQKAEWALPAQGVVFCVAVAVVVCLLRGRFGFARVLVALQVAAIIVGFGLAMDGHFILPDMAIADAGARAETMGPLVPILVVGALIVVPSLWFLFRLFKARTR